MSAFAQPKQICFRANVVNKSAQAKRSQRTSSNSRSLALKVESAKKSVGDLTKKDLEGSLTVYYR